MTHHHRNSGVDLEALKKHMQAALTALHHEFSGLRAGRASTSLLEPITVESYGSRVPLQQVANISAPEARLLTVSVWDKSMVAAVEKAIRESSLSLNPIVDGSIVRVPIPELNEERRRELVRIAHQYVEQARIAVRHVRREGLDCVKKAEKDKHISQDEGHLLAEKIQKLTDEFIAHVEKAFETKEADIMQV